jgi:hypothetical protein
LDRVVESVNHGEGDLTFLHEQPRAYCLLKQRIHPVCKRSELALIESTEGAAGTGNGSVRKRRLEIEEDAAGNQASMDSLEGVHDALKRQSSQRVREKHDVEAGRRSVQFERATNLEADTRSRFHSQPVLSFGDRLGARIDRKDRVGGLLIAESEPAVAATDLENACAIETAESQKSLYLSFRINHVDLESQLKEPRLTGVGRFQSPCGSVTVNN